MAFRLFFVKFHFLSYSVRQAVGNIRSTVAHNVKNN